MYASHVRDYREVPRNYSDPYLGAGYGTSQNSRYEAYQNSKYGMPQNSRYETYQNPKYGMPQNSRYETYQNPTYGMPQNSRYETYQNSKYGMPQNQQYGMPRNQQYGTPQISTIGLQPGTVGYNPGLGVVMTQPAVVTQPAYIHANDNMTVSILSCLFCFWPLGIVAISFSSMASNSFAAGNYREGRKYSRIAGWLALTSFLLGLATLGIALGVIFGRIYSN